MRLGGAHVIEEIMVGEDRLIHFSGVALGQACTIVLRGASEPPSGTCRVSSVCRPCPPLLAPQQLARSVEETDMSKDCLRHLSSIVISLASTIVLRAASKCVFSCIASQAAQDCR